MAQPSVMVKLKDYACFVSKDVAGRKVVTEGQRTLKQETVEQTRRDLEDAGRHDAAAKTTERRRL